MNKFTLWLKVRKLQKSSDDLYKEYKKEEEKAKQNKLTPEQLHEIGQMYSQEGEIFDIEIMQLHTRYLQSKAQKLLLPMPDFNDETLWKRPNFSNRSHLTSKGVTQIRSDIRKELHERRAGILTWVAALTGLIGAISGLVAVIGINF